MKNINWKVRLRNPHFIIAIVSTLILLVEQVLQLFGYGFDQAAADEVLVIVRTVLSLLAVMGVVEDPTTSGAGDSAQALKYERPRKDDKK